MNEVLQNIVIPAGIGLVIGIILASKLKLGEKLSNIPFIGGAFA